MLCILVSPYIFILRHSFMKAALLFLFVFVSVGAFAQSSDTVRSELWEAGPDGGGLTLISEDPLRVAEDPVLGAQLVTSGHFDPAFQEFTINLLVEKPNERIHAAVSDTTGKLVQSEHFGSRSRVLILSTAKLKTPGSYRVAVYRDDKTVLYWGTFQKQ